MCSSTNVRINNKQRGIIFKSQNLYPTTVPSPFPLFTLVLLNSLWFIRIRSLHSDDNILLSASFKLSSRRTELRRERTLRLASCLASPHCHRAVPPPLHWNHQCLHKHIWHLWNRKNASLPLRGWFHEHMHAGFLVLSTARTTLFGRWTLLWQRLSVTSYGQNPRDTFETSSSVLFDIWHCWKFPSRTRLLSSVKLIPLSPDSPPEGLAVSLSDSCTAASSSGCC